MRSLIIGRGKLGRAILRAHDPIDAEIIGHELALSTPLDQYDRVFVCCANTNTRGDMDSSYSIEFDIICHALRMMPDHSRLYTFGSNYETSSRSTAYIESKRRIRKLTHAWSPKRLHITLSNLYENKIDYLSRFPSPCRIPRGTLIEPLQVNRVASWVLSLTYPGEYWFRKKTYSLAQILTEHGITVIETDDPVEFPIDWKSEALGQKVYI